MRNKYNAKFYEGSTDHDTKYDNEKHNNNAKDNKEEISNEFDDQTVDYKNTLEHGQKYYKSAKKGNSNTNNFY